MIRRKLSTGLLRAATPSSSTVCPSVAGAAPGVRPRSRSLASAVLLSSQRNWKGETVVTLKTELKKRGLSQQGNKAALVARLESAETSSLLGPLPPFPNGSRSLSTAASVSQPPKKSSSASAAASSSSSSSSSKKQEPKETVTSAGPQVSSEKHDHDTPAVMPIEPENVTVAPGLPQTKDLDAGKSAEQLDIKFPVPQAKEEVDQVIPITPDNYAAAPVSQPPEPSSSPLAKVLTVASASTHLSGGPVHGVHESADAHSIEAAGPSLKDIPSFTDAVSSIFSAPGRAWTSVGVKFPEVHLPPAPEGSKAQYKREQRGLNDQERTGTWVLAGVVGLGLFLGGGSKKSKSTSGAALKDTAQELADKAKGVKTVKGDANWAKASGAGVVGHGTRKD
ncbi:hypothetical protein I316_01131 [Kwoniella heveanensis BCC8398]|uniref:SAP domain-containing protein n=1 Tax=Kwoniella heveanensis BCC8398 TaxID=1296120 RepID=A0A1B9H1V1_9TREE|nr:hypothetical protein I316_01131 [Kwoniella heveanensis BCC8398]